MLNTRTVVEGIQIAMKFVVLVVGVASEEMVGRNPH